MRNDLDNELLVEGYLSGKSCRQLGLEHSADAMTIRQRLLKAGVQMRNRWHGRTLNLPRTSISLVQSQIVDGCLLGDGSVFPSIAGTAAYFELSSVDKEFVEHLASVLPFQFRSHERPARQVIFHGKSYKARKSFRAVTKCDVGILSYRQQWYPYGKKIVPRNLNLSPTCVKYWFYGDGSSSFVPYKGEDRFVRLTFCTNCFSVDDCELLASKLKEVGLNFGIYLSRSKPMLITLKTSTVLDFFDYIGESDLQCFAYKWKKPLPKKLN